MFIILYLHSETYNKQISKQQADQSIVEALPKTNDYGNLKTKVDRDTNSPTKSRYCITTQFRRVSFLRVSCSERRIWTPALGVGHFPIFKTANSRASAFRKMFVILLLYCDNIWRITTQHRI